MTTLYRVLHTRTFDECDETVAIYSTEIAAEAHIAAYRERCIPLNRAWMADELSIETITLDAPRDESDWPDTPAHDAPDDGWTAVVKRTDTPFLDLLMGH